jgi:carboxypeptidase Taq
MEYLDKYKEVRNKLKAYQYMMNIVNWDSETEAPKEAFSRRAEMMGIISREYYRLSTSTEYKEMINELYSNIETLDQFMQREIKIVKKQLDKQSKIPEKEFVEYQKLLSLSQHVWEEAKSKNDWGLFKDNLKKLVEFNRKFITYYQLNMKDYDVLLDDFEEGMTMELYDHFFDTLKKELVPFVKQVLTKGKPLNKDLSTTYFDPKKQKEFCDYIIDVMAFDRNRGLMKESVHPFTWNTHPSDVRFTTRYLENYVFSSIFAAIHELGHATYEQQIDEKWNDTYLSGGASMGIHESQSRFYENVIGRSKAFWEAHYPKFKELFPTQTKDVSLEDFYRNVNKVEASLIRVEADELTYALHIMIRYDIERLLFTENVDVDTLPKIWNEKTKEYLGIVADNDADGVLQDVHWSAGLFGYFPTYALGTAYAAQFQHKMMQDLDLDELVRTKNIKAINEWLKEHIHQFGKSKTPLELLEQVTGEPFNPMYYVKYLKEKYTKLYL